MRSDRAHDEDATTRSDATARPPNAHRVLVPVLAVLGLVCILLSTVSIWVRDSALDSGAWAKQSGQLLQSEHVRSVISAYVAEQAITSTDAQQALEQALPPRLQPLAAPAAAGLDRLATDAVDRALQRPRVAHLWMEANRRANERLVSFLEGDTSRLQADGGNVVLNLDAIVADAAARVGASPSAVEKIQGRLEPIVLVQSDQLGAAQTAVELIHTLSIWPFVIGLVLFALAVYLAGPRRREAVRTISAGLLLIGLLLLAVRNLVGGYVIDSLVDVDSVKPAVHDVWSVFTMLLGDSAAAGIAIGVLGLVWTWVSGPTRAATSVRRRLAPAFRQHPLAPHAVLALLALLVLITSPVGVPRRAGGVVVVIALAFAGLEVVRRQAVREFPDEREGVGAALRGAVAGRGREPVPAAPQDRIAQLERLAELHDRGALNDEEYAREKALVGSS
jgi:hypothetical protein